MEHVMITDMAPALDWPEPKGEWPHRARSAAFAEGVAFVNNTYVPVAEATIPLLDWGFVRADACQETISVFDGQFFRLDDHVERLFRSVERLRMTCPHTRDELKEIAQQLVAHGGFRNSYVQLIMSRGRPPIGSRDVRLCTNRFQAYAIPYVWIATPAVQERGLHVHVSERRRIPAISVDPMVKHYHWLDFQMGLLDAYDRDAETVLLRDVDGYLAEGPGFNVFVARDGILHTPRTGVLDGMTRRTVMDLCKEIEIPVVEGLLDPSMLYDSADVFLTSTAGGIMPVTKADGKVLGDGTPGPLTRKVHHAYWFKRAEGWHAIPARYE